MPDPFADRPCRDCGKELPYKVLEAGDFLYGGGSVGEGINLADKIAEYMAEASRQRTRGYVADNDVETVEAAISWMLDFIEPTAFAAAVRHWGHVDDASDSECERIEAAKWCHERGPGKDSPDSTVWAASLCNLEAGHTEPHSFEHEPAPIR